MSIDTLSEIVSLLDGTILATQKAIELPIPQSEEVAFAIEVDAHNAYAAWELMRSQIDITGRYPVIIWNTGYSEQIYDWEKSIHRMDIFNRWSYEQETRQEKGTTPRQIIARSKSFDVDEYIAPDDDKFFLWQFNEEKIEDILIYAIKTLEGYYGKAPKIEELLDALGLADRQLGVDISGADIHEVKLEKWLLEWELANVNDDRLAIYGEEIHERDWFDERTDYDYGCNYALILLPTVNSWETLAYIHWRASSCINQRASSCIGSDGAIAFLKRWHERYQAELVCHFGMVLHLNTGRRPRTPQEAFDLSVEQFTFSDYRMRCNFGIADYATYLMVLDYWSFQQEKP